MSDSRTTLISIIFMFIFGTIAVIGIFMSITSCMAPVSGELRALLLEKYAIVVQECDAQMVDKEHLLNIFKTKTDDPEVLAEVEKGLADIARARGLIGAVSDDILSIVNNETLDPQLKAFILEVVGNFKGN